MKRGKGKGIEGKKKGGVEKRMRERRLDWLCCHVIHIMKVAFTNDDTS